MHKGKKISGAQRLSRPGLLRRHTLALALVASVLGIGLSTTRMILPLARAWNDWAVRLAAARESARPEVVLVVIDDESLHRMNPEIGRFPWPRLMYAPVIEHLSQASAIGFDILFPENEHQCGFESAPFLSAVEAQGHVVLSCFLQPRKDEGDPLSGLQPFSLALPPGTPPITNDIRAVLLPHPALLKTIRALGHVNRLFDTDGSMRAYPLWWRVEAQQMPSLALALAAQHAQRPLSDFDGLATDSKANPFKLPQLNKNGSFLYLPVAKGFRSYAFTDVLHSWREARAGRIPPIPPENFHGKIVLIGTTATGLTRDWVSTPLGPETPGLLLHAMALDNLLAGHWLKKVPEIWGYAASLALCLLFCLAVQNLPVRIGVGTFLLVALTLTADLISVGLFKTHLPFMPVVFSLLFCGGSLVVHYWLHERKEVLRLETLDMYKQQFTDMLVHDIKGKIGTLELSLSQIEDEKATLPPFAGEMAGIARATSRSLLTQVSALLDVRRLEEGRLELSRAPLELQRRLDEMAPEFHASAAALDLTFRVAATPALAGVTLLTDGDVFGRIVENFLWNAMEHATRKTEVVLGGDRLDNRVEIFIENEGPGIPSSETETLFEPYLTRRTHDRRGKGTHAGLGLAFCKMGSLALGGSVRLQSPLPGSGKSGVRASLFLPL